MKRRILALLSAAAMVAGSAAAIADQEVQIAGSAYRSTDHVAQATTACLEAFVAKVLPGYANKRFIVPASRGHEFVVTNAATVLTIQMSATSASSKARLANGSCQATGSGNVKSMTTQVLEPARLAALNPKDLQLGFNSR